MAKKPSIPAVPPGVSPEMSAFLNSVRQRLQFQDGVVSSLTDALAFALQYTEGEAYDNGPKSGSQIFRPLAKNGLMQRVQNHGAHTLSPPTENCQINLLYQNVTSAGAITVSGFTKVTGTSAPPSNSTTAAQNFLARITVNQGKSLLEWIALQ